MPNRIPSNREDQIGADLIQWADFVRRRYPRPIIVPGSDDPPSAFLPLPGLGRDFDALDLLFHVPNGVWTHPRIAASFVAQGLKRGVVDYIWPIRGCVLERVDTGQIRIGTYGALALELKRPRPAGVVSEDQAAFQAALKCATDWKVVTVWGLWEAAFVIGRYGGYSPDVMNLVTDDRRTSRRRTDPFDGSPVNEGGELWTNWR